MSDQSPIAPNTKLTLKLAWKTVAPEYDKALRRLAGQLKTAGFRKGKVPLPLARDLIGHVKIAEAALDKLLPEAYTALLKENNKKPLTYPDIHPVKIDLEQDWELSVEIAEQPELKLGKYQAVVKKARQAAEAELKKLETTSAPKTAKPSKEKGKKAPASEEAAPASQPALTEAQRKDQILKHVCSALVDEVKPAVPELLVRAETRRELEQLLKTLDQLNMKLDDYLARRQQTSEQLSGELAGTALARLQLEFVLQAVSEDAKLEATEADIQAKIDQIENPAVKAEYSKNPEYTSYLRSMIAREKTLDYLATLK